MAARRTRAATRRARAAVRRARAAARSYVEGYENKTILLGENKHFFRFVSLCAKEKNETKKNKFVLRKVVFLDFCQLFV